MNTTTAKKGQKLTYKNFRKSTFVNIMYDKGVLYFLLSFFIPFFMLLTAFRHEGVHMLGFQDGKFGEFGDKQFLVVDLWHQYYPFFRVVREKLLNGGSFLYSWENGMGTNFLSLISYYAASPLNWISVLFDDDHIRECLMYLLAAKIGFCSAFFSVFLRYTYKHKDISIVFFSVMFALCSYTLGYYWNVMWFDTIAFFPLVMTGVVALCRERKWKLYTIALALSLISNYYIGFFTCIFTMFMFASHAIIDWQGIKDFFKKIGLIVVSSAMGLGIGAFMLIPSYLALKLTYSANNTFPKEMKWTEEWLKIIGNLLSYNEPTSREGLPNIACGMLCLALLGVFLFSKGIKIREKIAYFIMLVFIIISCNENQLNFIWHGFHVTNQLPYRFSFIFSFILIALAYRAYDVIQREGLKFYQIAFMLIGPAAVFLSAYKVGSKAEGGFTMEMPFKNSLIMVGAYLLIFLAWKFLPLKSPRFRAAVLNVFVGAAVLTEVMGTTGVGVKSVGTSDYATYPTYNDEVQPVLKEMRALDKPIFYRLEMTGTYTLNDSALYGYNGVSQFSSSANVSVTRLFQRLGLYGSEAGNRFYYRNSTPTANMLLGLDYIHSKLGAINSNGHFLDLYLTQGYSNLYRNKYSIGLGFMMKREILNLPNAPGVNPFEYNNEIMRLASGVETPVYTAQPVKYATYENIDVTKNDFGSYSFTKTGSNDDVIVKYEFDNVDDATLYGYAANNSIESVSSTSGGLSVDDNVSVKDYPIVFPVSGNNGGDTSSITVKLDKDRNNGSYTLMTYALRHDVLDRVYDALADEPFVIQKFSDTEIEGFVDSRSNGILYLSIPYEKGWHVYVNGKEQETFRVLHSMTGVELNIGYNEIKLKYVPDGFEKGLFISGASLLLLICCIVIDIMMKRKAKAIAAAEAARKARKKKKAPQSDKKKAKKPAPEKSEEKAPDVENAPDDNTEENTPEEAPEENVPEEAPAEENAPENDETRPENEDTNEKSESNDGVQGN